MLDENEFLSPYGIRSLSRIHRDRPYVFRVEGQEHRVDYEPGESATRFFGGNSNWRGPVWLPVNYLIVESLEIYHHYYGGDFKVEYPTGSGSRRTLQEIANDLSLRLAGLFLPDAVGRRPYEGKDEPGERSLVLFHEDFAGPDPLTSGHAGDGLVDQKKCRLLRDGHGDLKPLLFSV